MGKPGKLKSGSKLKVKKWAKGSSCVSNPDLRKHREKAKSRFFHMQPTSKSNKGLTQEALQLHDEMQGLESKPSPMDETTSDDGQTFGTFLSGLSDCTNITFKKIQRYWMSNSAKHKEVCAVLAAITEVIRSQGAVESNTAYFAALVTALSSVEETESAAAVAYLLSMICKQVPVPVIQAKFGEVSKLLSDILNQHSVAEGSPPTALIRSVLSCLAIMLRQQERHVWSNASTLNIYNTVLLYTIHSKPKIRKAAHNAVCSVLIASSFIVKQGPDSSVHPAASATSKFCVAHLEKFGGVTSAPSVCHMLTLLGRILHCFPQQSLKNSCETILRLMTLSEPVVKSVCLQSLHQMFLNQPSFKNLPAEMNAQIISALYDFYPNSADAQMCPAWLAVMGKALSHLSEWYATTPNRSSANTLAMAHIPKLGATCFKMMLSTSRVVAESACATVKTLLENCTPNAVQEASKADEMKFVTSIFKQLDDGLKYKFHGVWDLVFRVIHSAFKYVLKARHFSLVKSLIGNIVDLRNTQHFAYRDELDMAVGASVETLGPKLFLQAAPLNIDGTETDFNFPRSWFLPLFQEHVKKTEIGFYIDYFLPLAGAMRQRAAELNDRGHKVEATTYNTIQHQCWSLLPVFCKGATDIAKSFPRLARILGQALTGQEGSKLLVLQGLRNLLITCKSSSVEDTATMAKFAKNYLPILFNIYTTPEAMSGIEHVDEKQIIQDANKRKSLERLSALETIKLYLDITERSMVQFYFNKAKERVFDGDNENDATRLALLDVLINMVGKVGSEELLVIYQAMIPMLNSPNQSMQKKAYRLLEEICGSPSADCRSFVSSHLQELKKRLLDGLSASSPSSKGPRIYCIEQIIQQLGASESTSDECREFVQAVIPEVVMCTKDAKRSRVAAFSALVSSAKVFVSIQEDRGLSEYFGLIFTGLAGSPMMMKCSILALCRLVYEFKEQISSNLLDQTITNVCLLLGSNTREVCKAALSFIMVLFSILDKATLAQYLKTILDSLLNWKPETRRHFRFRVKRILQRLVQKFGFETIHSMTPQAHRKQLQNIRKVNDRSKRLQAERKEARKSLAEDTEVVSKAHKKETIDELLADSSGSEDDDEPKIKKRNLGKEKMAWLQESEMEPTNLLDSATSQQVLSFNPSLSGKSQKNSEFKTAPDGRLMIGDEGSGSSGDEDEETKKILSGIGIGKPVSNSGTKRKLTEEDKSSAGNSKQGYQPGGKGIHRILNSEPSGSEYRSKKSGGDVKRKGKHEPFAYIPLNAQMLNKRKQKKLSGQFAGLVKAAKKGAAGGAKQKSKRKRK